MGVGFSKVLTKKPEHEIPINASPDYTPQLTYKQPRKNLLIAPPLPLPPPKANIEERKRSIPAKTFLIILTIILFIFLYFILIKSIVRCT